MKNNSDYAAAVIDLGSMGFGTASSGSKAGWVTGVSNVGDGKEDNSAVIKIFSGLTRPEKPEAS